MLRLNRDLTEEFSANKFAVVTAADFDLQGHFDDFYAFCKSWENMGHDPYYGQQESGTRFRRYSDFDYDPVNKTLHQKEHRAYEQSEQNNRYVGGMKRDFADFDGDVVKSPVLKSLVDLDFEVYKSVLPKDKHSQLWQCQIHQIRIEIKPDKGLEITPEGIHCDGYPFSAVHFGGKQNVDGAESQLLDWDNNVIAAATYENRFDTTFFLDREMQHYVTPARTITPGVGAFRQILAVSFSQPGGEYETVR